MIKSEPARIHTIFGSWESRLERDLHAVSSDLVSALKVMMYGESADQDLAMRWIRAEPLPLYDCRKLGPVDSHFAATTPATR